MKYQLWPSELQIGIADVLKVVTEVVRNASIDFVQNGKSVGSWGLVLPENICPQFDPVLR